MVGSLFFAGPKHLAVGVHKHDGKRSLRDVDSKIEVIRHFVTSEKIKVKDSTMHCVGERLVSTYSHIQVRVNI